MNQKALLEIIKSLSSYSSQMPFGYGKDIQKLLPKKISQTDLHQLAQELCRDGFITMELMGSSFRAELTSRGKVYLLSSGI